MRQGCKYVLLIAMAISSVGCATKRYGRLQPVADEESRLMTCKELELEIVRAESFIKDIEDTGFDARDVLAILGDFGIGNLAERDEALKSGRARLETLEVLHAERCGG